MENTMRLKAGGAVVVVTSIVSPSLFAGERGFPAELPAAKKSAQAQTVASTGLVTQELAAMLQVGSGVVSLAIALEALGIVDAVGGSYGAGHAVGEAIQHSIEKQNLKVRHALVGVIERMAALPKTTNKIIREAIDAFPASPDRPWPVVQVAM